MNIDLLQNFDGVILDPFPHLIIKDALPEEVYEELEILFQKMKLKIMLFLINRQICIDINVPKH